jgi:O-antigen/teichoic acid export membrane protein
LAAFLGIVLARGWVSLLLFGTEDRADFVALAACCLTVVIAYNFLIELFTALRNIRLVSILQLINSIAFAALGVGLLFGWQCTAESVLLAYGGSCLIAAALAGCSLRRVWSSTRTSPLHLPQRAFWPKLIPFAAWVLLANVLTNLFEVVDRYMIVHFSKETAASAMELVGNYHTSRIVPMLLVSIAAMLSAMIVPHLSHDWEAGRREQVAARLRLFIKLFGFALFAASVAVLIAAPLLFGMAMRGKFPGGQAVLPWTLVYCTWFGLSMILQGYLLCVEKARLASVSLACGLVLNVLLNLVLLPRLGLEGAVLATAAANALSLGLVCLFNRRLGFRLDDGAKLVLALPMLVCLGPWVSLLAMAAVVADAIWSNRLLSPGEKRQLTEGAIQYGKRFGLDRLRTSLGRV